MNKGTVKKSDQKYKRHSEFYKINEIQRTGTGAKNERVTVHSGIGPFQKSSNLAVPALFLQ